jgi:hypothetical protein
MWSAGQGDDKERFLADLRALRGTAALGYEELAARAHYPSDVLKEVEHGPSLPGLPILAAYVRACDGDVPEWEERWRRLGVEVRVDPGLPVRPAGASPAAVAGARAGVGVAPPDTYDPERIRAALRGAAVRTDLAGVARKVDASWAAASDQGSAAVNGNHQARRPGDPPPDASITDTPDSGAAAAALREDPFSSSWLHDSQPIPPGPGTELGRQDRAGGARTSPEDGGQAPPGWRDFWTPAKATAGPTEVQRPSMPQPAEEPTTAGTSWSAFTPSPPKVPDEPVGRQAPDSPQRAEPMVTQVAAPVPSQTAPSQTAPSRAAPSQTAPSKTAPSKTGAEPAVPQPSPAPPGAFRSDRYYPLRLLAVIVVAALIGSILVLLLR